MPAQMPERENMLSFRSDQPQPEKPVNIERRRADALQSVGSIRTVFAKSALAQRLPDGK